LSGLQFVKGEVINVEVDSGGIWRRGKTGYEKNA